MKFDPFVLPFTVGLIIMLVILWMKYTHWFIKLNSQQRNAILKNIFTVHTLKGLREIFFESLLHRKIFRKNRLLGYMHMSLAFGWFLLIIVGHLEASAYFGNSISAPYVPIFLRYFQWDTTHATAQNGYWFIMDTLLLFILSGVGLAWYKRRQSARFGMAMTTQHSFGDKLALSVLWMIFPLRLLAESITSILYGGGSYLTFGFGSLMEETIANWFTFYTAWWAYSISLGAFFVALPFSRYMHIPTEAFLIMLRNWGVKPRLSKVCGMAEFELHSCSSCGICLDVCQLVTSTNNRNTASPYLFKSLRNLALTDSKLHNCLMCGRCQQSCVVGINTTTIRQAIRNSRSSTIDSNFQYIENVTIPTCHNTDVIYFAGCMTHLTPRIKRSMISILNSARINFSLLDENESICCGRPMMLAGMTEQAEILIRKNKLIIENSGAKTLVTSCPICYKIFKESYNLKIEVMHHTQYLYKLIRSGKILLEKSDKKVAYHDPCDLGRGSGVYNEPRYIIRQMANLTETEYTRENALCCGGSIANSILSSSERKKIAVDTLEKITTSETDKLITSCPLCKKTFAQAGSAITIMDIAELVDIQMKNIEKKLAKESIKSNITSGTYQI